MVGATSVVWRPVRELVPYAKNARAHSEKQVGVIAASIGRFGFNSPVLVDENGEIISGHGRVLAAQRLGLEQVPVVVLSHLDDSGKRAYRISDNKPAELGEWDEDLLRVELAELEKMDINLDGVGFDERELAGLLADLDAVVIEAEA